MLWNNWCKTHFSEWFTNHWTHHQVCVSNKVDSEKTSEPKSQYCKGSWCWQESARKKSGLFIFQHLHTALTQCPLGFCQWHGMLVVNCSRVQLNLHPVQYDAIQFSFVTRCQGYCERNVSWYQACSQIHTNCKMPNLRYNKNLSQKSLIKKYVKHTTNVRAAHILHEKHQM